MTNKLLIFAGIFATITTSSFATGENTVTSKSYVDAQDALKQDKIKSGTEGSVVIYDGTDENGQTQFDERGIYYGVQPPGMDDETKLTTVGGARALQNNLITNIDNTNTQVTNINNQINSIASQDLESISVPSLTCANNDCTLYTVSTAAGVAHKLTSCKTATVATDCPACGTGTVAACVNDVCKCNACSGYNISASSASQCCSGYLISGNKCGCTSNAECVAWAKSQVGTLFLGTVVCRNDHTCGSSGSGGGSLDII